MEKEPTYDVNATIEVDGSISWWGVSTGTTELVAINEKEGIAAFWIGGQTYRVDLLSRGYAAAHFKICRFKYTDKKRGEIKVEFFGSLMEFNARRPWKDPK